MKKFIIGLCIVIAMSSCCKKESQIRTCKVTLVDGTKKEYPSTIPLTCKEISNYENGMKTTYGYKDIKCK